jgi:hypothetical protein
MATQPPRPISAFDAASTTVKSPHNAEGRITTMATTPKPVIQRRRHVMPPHAHRAAIIRNNQVIASVPPRELVAARARRREPDAEQIRAALTRPCCYALYAKSSRSVKIGLTTDIFHRWAQIEHASGMTLNLLALWITDHPAALEKQLHRKFARNRRRVGEWFVPAQVIAYLRDVRGDRRPPLMMRGHHPPLMRWLTRENTEATAA